MNEPVLWISLVIILVGLAGSVLPGLPGVPLIFLSALVYSILTDYEYVGGVVLAFLFVFALLALVADFVGTSYGARRFGASNWGTIGGALGGIAGALAGALFFGIGALFGLILGTIGGVFLGEYIRRERAPARTSDDGEPETPRSAGGDWRRATRAAGGVFVGYVVSAIAQGILAVASIVVFVLALIY